ncbi:MAG TPA: Asp-tRNA(Asn)/Glu-tRNA(Gln) amidotransferase GatCAB subunit C [Candidatus Magasanikbacteria bacterium]|nr:MAG: hypothetical protein A3I74_00730 [Candidatus Magasanikbacteria bacterium RIFCSPLOWO2_02_FULL_47_16]OGH80027.1 MAG: hypothetical protein A3C10_02495 [Candidatus Magasanikbacteria bacterium RIFCSPHIGHO2_02_FULL_48_18]OGH83275.1 MAG: hypothetical protein A3G08_02500 [Candidatus Magasanikbacteria bacterium RIFCSPLOWO2_12_FULL_47_9b]HAZ28494.1 Asp-tRNA(Asn)/Glu-tRNA(Gln) amidotransferase GatCAB subunit C [Candidatus Magasanikbacteria bacterium]
MQLTSREIEQIARLARLELTDQEKERYATELSVVLEYIAMLNEVDTEGIPETTQVTGLKNTVREDVAAACDDTVRQALLNQFPSKIGHLLQVKAVFQDDRFKE